MLSALLLVTTASLAAETDDRLRSIRTLERAVAANPQNASNIRELAHAYALGLLGTDPDVAKYSAAALDASRNVWILGNAAYILQCQYNDTRQRHSPNSRARVFAEQYFLQAQRLDSKLDRRAILPEIDMQQIERDAKRRSQEEREAVRRFEEAAKHIRYLELQAFPNLPPRIAATLRARHCQVPQPTGAVTPRNVISGEFFEPGQPSWAVLCSVNGWSSLLVFGTAQEATPHILARSEDRNYLQDLGRDSIGYSREIHAVGRQFILAHDRGLPVSKPTRITHQGIDDAFLDKASRVWYFNAGKWYALPGAD